MSDLIERLRASENQIAQPGYLSLATRARIEEELHQAAAELTRLRSQPTITSEEVQQAVMSARKHVKSRTAGDGAYGEGEDCVALDMLDQLANLIESLARSEAEERGIVDRIWDQLGRPTFEALHGRSIHDLIDELLAHKADAELLWEYVYAMEASNIAMDAGKPVDVARINRAQEKLHAIDAARGK